jgi:hypothetical protein
MGQFRRVVVWLGGLLRGVLGRLFGRGWARRAVLQASADEAQSRHWPVGEESTGPGRVRIRRERRRLPSGRLVEFTTQAVTKLSEAGTYETLETIEVPATDCGCSPSGLDDVYSCHGCNRTVCGRHAATCQGDGFVYCSACLCEVAVAKSPVIVCRVCATRFRPRLLGRLLDVLLS